MWEALNPLCQRRADWASFKFIQRTGRLHFSASFTQKLKMIRCCLARVWASSSTTELLVNGEGHRCRWFIYSPSEAFKLLKSISCADKLTYWSKATKPRHLLVRTALRTLRWKKDCVYCHPQWGTTKTCSRKLQFFLLSLATNRYKAPRWVTLAGRMFLRVEL